MNEYIYYRLIAQWCEDPLVAIFTLDLQIIDNLISSDWDIFGSFDLDGVNTRPFVLRKNGQIDFGSLEPIKWTTNLRSIKLVIGNIFHISFNDQDSGTYKIVKIAALGQKRSRPNVP